ncbi:MAG: thiamine pyrophosphate-dependent enzyme [Thermomicrobiales bacterium]
MRVGHHAYNDLPLDDLLDALIANAKPTGRPAAHRRSGPSPRPHRGRSRAGALRRRAGGERSLRPPRRHADGRRHGRLPVHRRWKSTNTALVAPAYYAGMGFGVPAGLGLGAATGQRPVILVGDGAFQMTGLELGNCRRYGWAPIVVLFNNKSWEMLRVFKPEAVSTISTTGTSPTWPRPRSAARRARAYPRRTAGRRWNAHTTRTDCF